ncbi:MAG: helix-turn-helix transcriptional regulator [Arenicella sp.]
MNQTYKIDYDSPFNHKAPLPDILRFCSWEEVTDNIRVNCTDFINATPQAVKVTGPPVFSITVFIDGYGYMKVDNGKPMEVTPSTVAIFYSPREASGEHRLCEGSRIKCVDIRFEVGLIDKLNLLPISNIMNCFDNQFGVNDVHIATHPATAQFNHLAQSIFNCEMTGLARKVFLNAKALEALSLIISSKSRPHSLTYSSKKDIALIEAAAKLLQDRYSERWTIELIAQNIGLNEKKLKIGFRQLMGNTIQKYLEDIRLNYSAKMLLDGASVTEACYSVGYSNPSHFAKAFRRIYGVSPSQWRKSNDH